MAFSVRVSGLAVVGILMISSLVEARADTKRDPRAVAFLTRPAKERLANPRATIETLCFDVYSSYRIPGQLADGVQCIDFDPANQIGFDRQVLLVVELNEILDMLSLPFRSLPENPKSDSLTFYKEGDHAITLNKCEDGLWRFSRSTVTAIPELHRILSERAKKQFDLRRTLQRGMGDPTATIISFLVLAADRDFESAALRLDLSDISPEDRPTRGPYLAWKLAATMQRQGFSFPQDIPVDPDGRPYSWYASQAGRVVVQRIVRPGEKERWGFTRETVAAIDSLWEEVKNKEPDVRYVVLDKLIATPPDQQPPRPTGGVAGAPPSVPASLASPRRAVRGFLGVMDQAAYNDEKLTEAYSYLDLSNFPLDDFALVGPRRAQELFAILSKIRPDLGLIPDRWSVPPQTISTPGGIELELQRQPDGRWLFGADTVAKLPAMYESLTPADKAVLESRHNLASPRDVILTFLDSVDRRDDIEAGSCLDLSELPTSARAYMGPILAFKLKYAIDRIMRIYVSQIPATSDGPQYVLYRGPAGRISLAQYEKSSGNKVWGFSADTVRRIDAIFEDAIDRPVATELADLSIDSADWKTEPGVWLRLHMPAKLTERWWHLAIYQWIGAIVLIGLSVLAGRVARMIVTRFVDRHRHSESSSPTRSEIHSRLRGLRTVVRLGTLYWFLEWLDLPTPIASAIIVVLKLALILAMTWFGIQIVDMFVLFHDSGSKSRGPRGLADLFVPLFSALAKLAVIVAGAAMFISELGQGEALGRFFAGVGIVGLAVSLAAQDTLKNLFGTIMLMFDRSFRIGDQVRLGDKEGIIEQVGLRSTKIRTMDDSIMLMPNSVIANGSIDNLGMRNWHRIYMVFSVPTSTPVDDAIQLREEIREFLKADPECDPHRSQVHLRLAKGLEIELIGFFRFGSLEKERAKRDQVSCEVLRLAKEKKITVN